MAIEVTMPKFGLTMHEGTVQRFFKNPGDAVVAGEPLYEVETEKVLYEVEAPVSGTLAATLCADGDTVECGVTVAVIAQDGENPTEIASRYNKDGAAPRTAAAAAANGPKALTAASPKDGTQTPDARRSVSPVARKLAAELGLDLGGVTGSGPGGRITREDVERAANEPGSAPSAVAPPPQTALKSIPFRGIRKTIAERMRQSLRDSAQLTITTEADVTPATELRARIAREYECSVTDLIIHAVARALVKHPRLNSRLDGNQIVASMAVNVGIAVSLEDGLIVPVIGDAARKPLAQIALESKALAERARLGRLKLEDVTGGTFTITNLGPWGVDAFTPILNPGETAILGVGRIVEKPAIYRGEITRRAMITLSLTFDHSVVDGAPAAEFLQSVVEILNYGER
ncbi:MAG: dihydrolipoamide acetyltransferase family protein [Candidatus Binataceae bacterium]